MSKVENPLVGIVYLAEGDGKNGAEYSSRIFKSLEEQVYHNTEIIIVHLPAFDVETFKAEISQVSIPLDVDIKYHQVANPSLFLDDTKKEFSDDVEYVFLKTSHPIIWDAFHIAAHVENWKSRMGKRKNYQLSNISVRNIMIDPKSPVGALGYRITDPRPEDVLFDEVSMTKDAFLQTNWTSFLSKNGEQYSFDVIKHFEYMKTKGVFRNEEITVYQLMQNQPPLDKSKIKLQQPNMQFSDSSIMFVDADGNLFEEEKEGTDLVVLERFPTIVGNQQWDEEHNKKVIGNIASYEQANGTKFVRKIGVKRTMGMGDVVLTYSFVKFLSDRYPEAEIYFYTGQNISNISCVKMFADVNVVEVRVYDSRAMLDDVLAGEAGLDLRFDLDLAYESRADLSYPEAYFTAMGYAVPEGWDLVPHMKLDHSKIGELYPDPASYASSLSFTREQKVIAFCPEGSGWPGKELPAESWVTVLKMLKDMGYEIALTTNVESSVWQTKYKEKLTPFISYWNDKEDNQESFKKMFEFVMESCGYIGSDNGVMHLATAFNKPMLIVSGAALMSKTTAYKNVVNVVRADLDCIGCKHRFFFDIQQTPEGQHLTFVPPCTNSQDAHACMKMDVNYIIEKTNEFVGMLDIAEEKK